MNLIEAKNIEKSYWIESLETPVLKGVDLVVGEKDRVCIVGASGAGKSTLLHIMSSLDAPTRGEVLFRGENLYARSDDALSQLRNISIGFVFQFHHLLSELTAVENVMTPLLIRKESKAAAHKKSLALLERLGLGARAHHLPSELSGGEQQRVAVARALVNDPAVLFADEPTGNLDQESGEKLMDLFDELTREQSMSLVMVTHNTSLSRRFSRTIHLADGRVAKVS